MPVSKGGRAAIESVLALDIGGTKLAAAIVDELGVVQDRDERPVRSDDSGPTTFRRALELAGAVLTRNQHVQVRRFGVATKGLTRTDGVLFSGMSEWSALKIPMELSVAFPDLATVISNDVKAATRAEMAWGALRNIEDAIYVNLGTGLSAGFVVRGALVEGADGMAGEIGYLLPSAAAMQSCLRRNKEEELPALLEERVGGGFVARRSLQSIGRSLTMVQLRDADDVDAVRLFAEILSDIAMWVTNLVVALNPRRVVIGGGLSGLGESLFASVGEALERCTPFPPELMAARFGADSALVGAGAAALGLPR